MIEFDYVKYYKLGIVHYIILYCNLNSRMMGTVLK